MKKANETFYTAEEGLNYFQSRMELLRQTLIARNAENADLKDSLGRYRFMFWLVAAFGIGLLITLVVVAEVLP